MPRPSKEFTESTSYEPNRFTLQELEQSKYLKVYEDLQNRVLTGKNWGRRQENKAKLRRFAMFFISKKLAFERFVRNQKDSSDEHSKLNKNNKILTHENVMLQRKVTRLEEENAKFKSSKTSYRQQQRGLSKALQEQLTENDKLEDEITKLRNLLNSSK